MSRAIILLAALLFSLFFAYQATAAELRGRVRTGEDGRGVPALTVTLVPRSASSQPKKITITNEDGAFRFKNVGAGHYDVEVSRGVELLRREPVDVDAQDVEKELVVSPPGR